MRSPERGGVRKENVMACRRPALACLEYKAKFGAAWVNKYVLDRLAPIAVTLPPA
jgi:hypothetical protein